jgi:hypothetical protein
MEHATDDKTYPRPLTVWEKEMLRTLLAGDAATDLGQLRAQIDETMIASEEIEENFYVATFVSDAKTANPALAYPATQARSIEGEWNVEDGRRIVVLVWVSTFLETLEIFPTDPNWSLDPLPEPRLVEPHRPTPI